MNVAVVHAPALKTREQHVRGMCTAFAACGATVAVVMGPEPPVHDPTLLATVVNMDPNKLGNREVTAAFKPFIQDMKVRQLSNALKHAAAIQHISQGTHAMGQWHLVVEDDSMIEDAQALVNACASAPADADILFFGLPSPLPHPTGGLEFIALKGIKVLPSCDAYALRMQTARFLSSSMLPIRFRTEIHLSWLIASMSIKAYLTSPNLSVDGSKVGMFVSAIESNNRLSYNPEYVLLSAIVDATHADQADMVMSMDTFSHRLRSMPFGGHPDAQVLLGKRLAQCGRHTEAMSVFEAALALYISEGAVVGNDSLFLRVYMDLFKHTQPDIKELDPVAQCES